MATADASSLERGLHFSRLTWKQIQADGLGPIPGGRPLAIMHEPWVRALDDTAASLARHHKVERLTLVRVSYDPADIDREHSRCQACRHPGTGVVPIVPRPAEHADLEHWGLALLRVDAHIPPDRIEFVADYTLPL